MKRLLLIAISSLVLGCYSAPQVKVSDTTAQQQEVKQAVQDIQRIPMDSTVGPKDAAVIARAQSALQICGASLERTSAQLNDCSAKIQDLAKHYKDQGATIAKLEKENGFFGRIGRFFRTLFIGIGIGAAGLLILQEFGGALITVAKSKIP